MRTAHLAAYPPLVPFAIAQVTPWPWEQHHEVNGFVERLSDELCRRGHRVVVVAPSDSRELIRDGVTGFLFAPDDPSALARRVADAVGSGGADADAMRAAGRRFIETERSWPASAAHYEPLYRALRQRARRPQPA